MDAVGYDRGPGTVETNPFSHELQFVGRDTDDGVRHPGGPATREWIEEPVAYGPPLFAAPHGPGRVEMGCEDQDGLPSPGMVAAVPQPSFQGAGQGLEVTIGMDMDHIDVILQERPYHSRHHRIVELAGHGEGPEPFHPHRSVPFFFKSCSSVFGIGVPCYSRPGSTHFPGQSSQWDLGVQVRGVDRHLMAPGGHAPGQRPHMGLGSTRRRMVANARVGDID